jgi:ABC-type dipeptide/oligopeptide/nickel transport system permease subunit
MLPLSCSTTASSGGTSTVSRALNWQRAGRWSKLAAFPGAAIILAILGLNLLGDALNDVLQPPGCL